MSFISGLKLDVAVTAGVLALLSGGIGLTVHAATEAYHKQDAAMSETNLAYDKELLHAFYVDNFNENDFDRLTWGHQDDISDGIPYKSETGSYTMADGSIKQVYFSNKVESDDAILPHFGGLYFAGTTKEIPSAVTPAEQK